MKAWWQLSLRHEKKSVSDEALDLAVRQEPRRTINR
jgi:hypothetical protein